MANSLVGWHSWEEVVVRAERHRGGGGAEEGCQLLGLIGHRMELDFIPRGGSEVKSLSHGISLEGMMLKLKLRYFSHLM